MRMDLDGSNPEDVTAADLGLVSDLAFPSRRPGDLDHDGAVDDTDFGLFADCLTGPDIPAVPGCESADLQGDGDVDLADCGVFQRAFTGA
jgi:hypothetical protein